MHDAQILLERAASRSMTLLADEIQQVPTRIPPISDQTEQSETYRPVLTAPNALGDSSSILESTSTKLQSKVREESFSDEEENLLKDVKDSMKHNVKLSVTTSPIKSAVDADPRKLLNSVCGTYLTR